MTLIFREKIHRAFSFALALAFSIIFIGTANASSLSITQADNIFLPIATSQTESAPLCRFGVNSTSNIASFSTAPLRIGWYLNYSTAQTPVRPNGIEYTQMIRLQQLNATTYRTVPSAEVIEKIAAANPGSAWFIGNEPDRRIYQDDMEPHMYAKAYHDLYHLIKEVDPTAQILAGSIVQPTPLRLLYLDAVLDEYYQLYKQWMPVDGWSIHNFILNEASCAHYKDLRDCWGADIPPGLSQIDGMRIDVQDTDSFTIFQEQIVRFRQWMTKRGYQGVPLYLSEYGVLMPVELYPEFSASRVNAFMSATFDYLRTAVDSVHGDPADGYRLIQRFSWYSTTDTFYNGRLFDATTKDRTEIGNHFAAYTSQIAAEADFYPVKLTSDPIAPFSTGGAVPVTLKTTIANSGNTVAAYEVRVRFYRGDPKAGGTQIGAEQIVSLAGCGDTQIAEVVWQNALPGVTEIYVSVEPVDSSAPEPASSKSNNVQKFSFLVSTQRSFLPHISR